MGTLDLIRLGDRSGRKTEDNHLTHNSYNYIATTVAALA